MLHVELPLLNRHLIFIFLPKFHNRHSFFCVKYLFSKMFWAFLIIHTVKLIVHYFWRQGDRQMRMPMHDDYKAEELLTDVGGNAEGPEEVLTVDEYLMPQKWSEEEKKKSDEVWLPAGHLTVHILRATSVMAPGMASDPMYWKSPSLHVGTLKHLNMMFKGFLSSYNSYWSATATVYAFNLTYLGIY